MTARKYTLTRYAPTPSGYLHLGNICSFALTAHLAQQQGAAILLRIDDMDRERFRPEYLEDIFESLAFLGLPYHRGPESAKDFDELFSQRQRLSLYQDAITRLERSGKLFACSCSRSETGERPVCRCRTSRPEPGKPFALRLDTTGAASIRVRTPGGMRPFPFPASMKDFIVRKKDGMPAYQVCSVLDDLEYGVDLVVRGQDLFDSTLAQLFLAEQLGEPSFEQITFVHHPLLHDGSGQKLSKSAGATSVHHYRLKGEGPEAVYRDIARAAGREAFPGSWPELAEVLDWL